MERKKLAAKLGAFIIVSLMAAGHMSAAYADDAPLSNKDMLTQAVALYEKLKNEEVAVPESIAHLEIDEDFKKSVVLGYVNFDDADIISEVGAVRKQDVMNILYKTVINYDDKYAIDTEEADTILNECFDNAYIDEENRIAYAFMLKHGIIADKFNTEPNKELTWDSCRILIDLIYDFFVQNTSITIGEHSVTIGMNVDSLIEEMGNPNRIDDSEYGFKWYVYNDNYSSFCMVGVEADRVCAFFSNSGSFSYDNLSSGDDFAATLEHDENKNFTFFGDSSGKIDAIMYNPREKGEEDTTELRDAKSNQLLDMINARRSKNADTIYSMQDDLTSAAWLANLSYSDTGEISEGTISKTGYDVFSIYNQLINEDNEILTDDIKYNSAIGIDSVIDGPDNLHVTVTTDSTAAVPLTETEEVEPAFDESIYESVEPVEEVTTPVLASPATETVYNDGDSVIIELETRASDQYHIEVFDVENDNYVINEFIITDKTEIELPSEIFSSGRDYEIVISSITESGESLASEPVLISYGSIYETGVKINTPFHEGITDDDYINLSWESDAYNDFYVDLYRDGELIASKVIEGEYEARIEGVEPGQYYLYVTALRRGTLVEKAQDYVAFEVKEPEPVITEYILENDATFYPVYSDDTLGVVYFYEEEIVDVEEVVNGRTVTSKKKKLIQKQVKATNLQKQKSNAMNKPAYVSGDINVKTDFSIRQSYNFGSGSSSEIGQAIVDTAAQYLGVPYVWGGTTPAGFDCSGLVQYVCESLGISVNRVAEDQFTNGVAVAKEDLQPGDLIFFADSSGYIHHVGIYAGNNTMLHAPRTGDVVKYQSLDNSYYQEQYCGARRVY